ncbi:Hemicentin-2 [Stylophora pistillata]|uniref:Hemicentin-2 n=1 Tax=Stylophora pistillata TaxID=50429 RepID=A0A2B4REJ5_STYPI|nr:Hemicentin-2 [Stylophora pistillata]
MEPPKTTQNEKEPSEIVNVSKNQDVCEGSMVALSCNATGKPAPNITWTRKWENGTDSGELPSVDGYHPIYDIGRSSNGTYCCTAFNGVGDPVNQTVEVIVRYSPSVDGVVGSPNTATEGRQYNLTCNVSWDPPQNVSWIKVSNDKLTVGSLLQFNNISRNDAGDYKCVASNRCGNDSKTEAINVLYKPAYVILEKNATENKDCFDLWVNFNCTSSKANPPVYNYLLLKNGTEFTSSKSGTWIEKISEGGKAIYSCIANQSVENVSSENITLTVNVPTSLRKAKKETVSEGHYVQESCLNITGFPYPTVMWEKNGSHIADGNLLNFTQISRDKAGEYRCTANNTCGNASTMVYIDVQYEPENVKLSSNTTRKEVCAGIYVKFTCTADANPPVHTYLLYENDTKVDSNLGNTGIWIPKLETGGKIVFRCTANNSIQETRESNDTVFFVKVPPSVKQMKIEPITEGDTVEMYCNATGSPNPTVKWTKGENVVSDNSSLMIENIRRNEAGDYRCTANNTCGNASTAVYVDVQYKPENVMLISNTSSEEVCAGVFLNLTCTADANPPVHTYLLYENDVVIQGPNNTGIWMRRLDKSGNFTYRCKVNTSFPGIEESKNLTFTVRVPPSLRQASKKSGVEGSDIKVYCNATGIPNPTVWWTKVNDVVSNTSLLTFLNISRDKAGEYQCIASNTCENTSAMVYIDVQ